MKHPLKILIKQINLRHARERPLRTSLTVVGVAAGVALVVSIMLINDALIASVQRGARVLAGTADLEVAGADRTGLPQRVVATVEDTVGVGEAIPVLRSTATIRTQRGEARVLVLGVTRSFVSLFPAGAGSGEAIEIDGGFGSGEGLVLSAATLDRIGADVGDRVRVETPSGFVAVRVTGRVAGDALARLNDGHLGAMWLPAAQATFQRPERVDSIYVLVPETEPVGDVRAALAEKVQGAVVGPPGLRTEGFEGGIQGVNALTSIAGTVALFVGAFVVYNTMSMSVTERRKETALAVTFGATRKLMFTTFLGEAFLLGLVASIMGIAAGVGLAHLLVDRALDALRVYDIDADGAISLGLKHVLFGFLSGDVVATIGAFIPARRILRLAPVEGLRPRGTYEFEPRRTQRLAQIASPIAGALLIGAAAIVVLSEAAPDLNELEWLTNVGLLIGLAGATLLLPAFVSAAVDSLRPALLKVFKAPGRVAVDSLTSNRARTTVTAGSLVFTLGIVIGVAGAIESFEHEWDRHAREWFGAPLSVNAGSYEIIGSDQPLPAALEGALEQVDGVEGAYPVRYRVVKVGARQTVFYVIAASDQTIEDANLDPAGSDFRERVVPPLRRGQIVISSYMASQRGLERGDRLTIPTPSGAKVFTVGAIEPDLNGLDSLYIDSHTFLHHWNDARGDRFEVTIEDGRSVSEVAAGLEHAIASAGVSANVATREQEIDRMFDAITELFSVARGIQGAALVVAALAIANTMFITTYERRWELGLQQAIGMGRRQLRRALLLETAIIGIIGGLGAVLVGAGIGVGILEGMATSYVFDIPFEPSWIAIGGAVVLGVAIASIAGISPSRRAVQVPIIETLRFE